MTKHGLVQFCPMPMPDWLHELDPDAVLMVRNTFLAIDTPSPSTVARSRRRNHSAPPGSGDRPALQPSASHEGNDVAAGAAALQGSDRDTMAQMLCAVEAEGEGRRQVPMGASSGRGHASGASSGSVGDNAGYEIAQGQQGLPLQRLVTASSEPFQEESEDQADMDPRGVVDLSSMTTRGSPQSSAPSEELPPSERGRKRRPCKAKRDRYRRLIETFVKLAMDLPDSWQSLVDDAIVCRSAVARQDFIDDVLQHVRRASTVHSHSEATGASSSTQLWQ